MPRGTGLLALVCVLVELSSAPDVARTAHRARRGGRGDRVGARVVVCRRWAVRFVSRHERTERVVGARDRSFARASVDG